MEPQRVTRGLLLGILLILGSNVARINFVESRNPGTDTRVDLFKRAMLVSYGYDGRKPDPHSAVPLFEKVSESSKDKIAIHSLYELGTIHLFGYRRFFVLRYDVARAAECFATAAKLGHAESQFMMSFLHSCGFKDGPGVDKTKSLSYLKDAAKSNYTPALLALAYHHLYHEPTQDVKYAIKLYNKVLNSGYYPSQRYLVPLEDLKFSNETLSKYKESLKAAQNQMKASHEGQKDRNQASKGNKGKGSGCEPCNNKSDKAKKEDTKKKMQEIIDDYGKKDPENLPLYLVDIALMYLNGVEVPRNYEYGIQLLERAVSLGSVEAANLLGTAYFFGLNDPEEGRAIPVNLDLSLKYFKISAAAHEPESLYFLGELVSMRALKKGAAYLDLEVPQSYKLFRLSADYGYSQGYLRCAQILENGIGLEKDPLKAALDYKTYTEQILIEDLIHQYLYYLFNKNRHAATLLNRLAGYSGLAAGQWNAALMLKSNSCKIFPNEDIKSLFNEALLQGETDALFHLAKIAEQERKPGVARELYRRGFEAGDMNCLDPLIKMCSRDDLDRAVSLVQYKKYRTDIKGNNGKQGLLSNCYSKLTANADLAFLKCKRAIYKMF